MRMFPERAKNILVVRNDRFGEFLLNIPAFRALKETFCHSRFIAVVDPYTKELAQSIPFIDEIMEWGGHAAHSFCEKWRFIGELKKKRIDIAVMLNPCRDFNILTYLAGIPVRLGYDRKWGFLLTHRLEDKKYLGQKHEVEYNLELVSLIGAKTEDKNLSLPIDDHAINSLCQDFHINQEDCLVAVHPWTSDPAKQWPLENFVALTQKLLKEPGIKIVVIGGRQEQDKSKELFLQSERNFMNLTGRTALNDLAALLKRCRLLISGDSGPVHLACSVGTPVLAVFRSDIPAKSAKRWGPWGKGHTVIEKQDLNAISVDEVFHKAKERLCITSLF